ncbi:hypothetical protein CLU81_0159 [Flavobacterium sp. 9]|nr:hypothetical protein CLU81_0159 [Flavobacterium sp. 9]
MFINIANGFNHWSGLYYRDLLIIIIIIIYHDAYPKVETLGYV